MVVPEPRFSNLYAVGLIIKAHFPLWIEINYSQLVLVEQKTNGDT